MISSEVERTLVKSPPELWAELSDPAALSRHLGELGEIRIVRTEPESTVEWTAENTTGTVSLKPSGWGTKVKLSVTRELDEPPATAAEPVYDAASAADASDAEPTQPEALHLPTAAAALSEPTLTAKPAPAGEPAAEIEATAQREPGRGFFARLFGRRRARSAQESAASASSEEQQAAAMASPPEMSATIAEQSSRAVDDQPVLSEMPASQMPAERPRDPSDAFAAIREALAPETFAAIPLFETQPSAIGRPAHAAQPAAGEQPDSATQAGVQPALETPQTAITPAAEARPETSAVDISTELLKAEEAASEEVTTVLTAVLDRLGAAHHRPFSRA